MSEITIREVGQPDLDKFQRRIVQIFLDAFTTDGFAFNVQPATEERAIRYLRSLLTQGAVAFFAFDSGKVAPTTPSPSCSAAHSRLIRC